MPTGSRQVLKPPVHGRCGGVTHAAARCLDGFSSPSVVEGPWRGWIVVESASVKICVRIDSMMVAKSESGQPVRPRPPGESVSPVKTGCDVTSEILPGVWPGVWRTWSRSCPAAMGSHEEAECFQFGDESTDPGERQHHSSEEFLQREWFLGRVDLKQHVVPRQRNRTHR